ncbi:MAG: amidase [Myxococcales bacterium]|nr:amidase [Myxococcales bacterium]
MTLSRAELLQASALALARWIREGQVSSREVVEAHLARIDEVNPAINAVVASRAAVARSEADAADARLRKEGAGGLPPLHGVPCTIKEAFALEGMPHTSGLVARRGVTAKADAPAVARLKAAGAIPLGVTNVSELCLWMESDNRVWGRSNNPYDVTRTAGGSSGGEGAIVGAGGSPFGLGSDIGGSIRLPAFFNGVFGHKPSPGLVPNEGQYPVASPGVRLLGTGPLARRAEDLPLLLAVLSQTPCADTALDARRLEVLVLEGDGHIPVSGELLDAQAHAADALGRRGASVKTVRFEGLGGVFDMWAAAMEESSESTFGELLGQGTPLSPLRELGRFLVGRSPYTFPAVGLLALEGVLSRFAARKAKALEAAVRLEAQVRAVLGEDAVLLYPPYPEVAPRHGRPMLFPTRFVYTGLFNVLGLPVTQVPLGLGARGVPLGVQVAAAAGGDARTMLVAKWLEEECGGWEWTEVPSAGGLEEKRRPGRAGVEVRAR